MEWTADDPSANTFSGESREVLRLGFRTDPKTTATVFDQIAVMRDLGTAVLLVEQNARRALDMADIGCVLDLGRVYMSGPAADLLPDPALGSLYLGGSARSA